MDPKSVVCAFFKQGTCGKGEKCKFSHDLSLEGKSEKRSLYVDRRELEDEEGVFSSLSAPVSPLAIESPCRHDGKLGRREVERSDQEEARR